MIHRFDLSIYPVKLCVTYNATEYELNKEYPNGDTDGRLFKSIQYCSDAVAESIKDKDGIICVLIRFLDRDAMSEETIAHEAVHAANFVYSYIGATHDVEDDEPFAYLVSYIAKCCTIAKGVK